MKMGMRKMFESHAENIKCEQKDAFEKMSQIGQNFFLSIDEWTLRKNKKYMCVNFRMNESKVILLGMKQINGSMKAEDAVTMIVEKLSEFGLNLKNTLLKW